MNTSTNYNRKIAGHKAKAHGQLGEQLIGRLAASQGWNVILIPQGCKVLGRGKQLLVKSPFDFVISHPLNPPIFFDMKVVDGGNFTYSLIKRHQLRDLFGLHQNRQIAGYMIYFKESDSIGFADAQILAAVKPGSSIQHFNLIRSRKDFKLSDLVTASLNKHNHATGLQH